MAQEFRSSDEQIEKDVVAALNQRFGLDVAEVDVRVKNGTVILTGAVEEGELQDQLEPLVRNCNGVKDVENWVTVGPNQIDKKQVAQNLRRGDLAQDKDPSRQ